MNKTTIDLVQDINRTADRVHTQNKPRILRFKEVFNYVEHLGSFDTHINVTIRSLDGYIKVYNFPSETAFHNALVDIYAYGFANLKRIKKYIK